MSMIRKLEWERWVAQATTLVARSPITLDISVAGHARTRLLSELRAKASAAGSRRSGKRFSREGGRSNLDLFVVMGRPSLFELLYKQ